MLDRYIALIRQWINVAIYVWGGQGHRITSASQIRAMETSTKNADRAIALWTKRGKDCIAFDCSGLVLWPLQQLGLFSKDADMSADGLYRKAPKIAKSALRLGDLTFRIDSNGKAHHVGIVTKIVDGVRWVTEAEGRDKGVIERKIDAIAGYWEAYGRNPYIDTEVDEVIQKGMKGEIVRSWQEALLKLGFALPKYGADKDFGGETETATKAFQARHGLPETGIVDAATATKAMDALRLLPPDNSGYEARVAELTLQLEQARDNAANAASQADTATGELRTMAGIIEKYRRPT